MNAIEKHKTAGKGAMVEGGMGVVLNIVVR